MGESHWLLFFSPLSTVGLFVLETCVLTHTFPSIPTVFDQGPLCIDWVYVVGADLGFSQAYLAFSNGFGTHFLQAELRFCAWSGRGFCFVWFCFCFPLHDDGEQNLQILLFHQGEEGRLRQTEKLSGKVRWIFGRHALWEMNFSELTIVFPLSTWS